MKNTIFLFFFLLIAKVTYAQIPHLEVQDTLGDSYQLTDFIENDKNYIISFWATWCSPCKREYEAWGDYTAIWRNNYNVEVIAISIDNESVIDKAKELWVDKGWDGELLFTHKDSAKAALGVANIPRMFLFDDLGNIVYDHSGFSTGDEIELDQFIRDNFPIVNVEEPTLTERTIKLYQEDNFINVELSIPLQNGLVNLYSLTGEQLLSKNFANSAKEITISTSSFVSNQLYVLEVRNKEWRKAQLVFIK